MLIAPGIQQNGRDPHERTLFGNLTVEAMQRVNPEMGLEDGLAAKHGKSVGL